MLIEQELYKGFGNLHSKIITCDEPPIKVTKEIAQTSHTNLLMIGKYHMIFRSASLRDDAYNKIMACKKPKLTIELDEFYPRLMSQENIVDLLIKKQFTIQKTMLLNMKRIKSVIQNESIMKLDAFKGMTRSRLIALQRGKKLNNDELKIFPKTLYFPKEFGDLFAPSDFWAALNEL